MIYDLTFFIIASVTGLAYGLIGGSLVQNSDNIAKILGRIFLVLGILISTVSLVLFVIKFIL